MARNYRIGQIVPSSNVTMEAEVPTMIGRADVPDGITFTFHASRAPMRHVSPEELRLMNDHMARCARELMDARMDVIASACLVAIMCQGLGFHRETERELMKACQPDAPETRIVTSAGALVAALHAIGARRIAMITPYMEPLTSRVVDYLGAEGIDVAEAISLEISDNLAVAAQDPKNLIRIAKRLDLSSTDALVLSACVQMPSLAALEPVQSEVDVPVLSTAAATVFEILRALNLPTRVPHAGALLSGKFG